MIRLPMDTSYADTGASGGARERAGGVNGGRERHAPVSRTPRTHRIGSGETVWHTPARRRVSWVSRASAGQPQAAW